MRIACSAVYLCLASCLALVGCGAMVEFSDMEASLNADIGKLAPSTAVGRVTQFEYRDIDNETYELTWRRPDECSYAPVVRKSDRTIVGWHFLKSPAPTGCRFQSVKQLM